MFEGGLIERTWEYSHGPRLTIRIMSIKPARVEGSPAMVLIYNRNCFTCQMFKSISYWLVPGVHFETWLQRYGDKHLSHRGFFHVWRMGYSKSLQKRMRGERAAISSTRACWESWPTGRGTWRLKSFKRGTSNPSMIHFHTTVTPHLTSVCFCFLA